MSGEHSGPISLGNLMSSQSGCAAGAERINRICLGGKPLPQDDPQQRQPSIELARQQLTGSRLCHWSRVCLPPSTPSVISWKNKKATIQRVCFIGAACCLSAARGDRVVGLVNLNDYYDPGLKQARLRQIKRWLQRGKDFVNWHIDY